MLSQIQNTNSRFPIGIEKMQVVKFITHFLALSLLFILPEVLFSIGRPTRILAYLRPLIYLAVFYINYYFLIDRFLFEKRKRLIYFLINIFITIIAIIAIYTISQLCMPAHEGIGMMGKGGAMMLHPHPHPPHNMPPDTQWISKHALKMMSFLIRDGVLIIFTVALSIALKFSDKWAKWDAMQREIVAERQENELKNLKNQLNPHFLFNTLNNIYSLIAISQPKAQQSVHQLSQLLRYVLYENNDKLVPLEKDLKFVENYIELMRLRLSDNVTLTTNIDKSGINGIEIAPLLFISLVENAFKHGVSQAKPSFINIDIHICEKNVICKVENSFFPKTETDKSGSGIGLSNLKRQLSILYNDNYSLSTTCENDKYMAILIINIEKSDDIE